jgi:hypothetical protein
MKTNYQLLNAFEVAAVIAAVAGFVLVGIIIFNSLTPRTQQDVSVGANLFDLTESMDTASNAVSFMFDSTQAFYQQFYVAFADLTTLPPEVFYTPAQVATNFYDSLAAYSDQIVASYQANTQVQVAEITEPGKVLGISIEAPMPTPPAAIKKVEPVKLYYEFESIDHVWSNVFKNLKIKILN